MSWLQLRIDCDKAQAEPLEDALLAAGALSVTLEDREDEPLLEPAVGATPLWKAIRITGLFMADADMDQVLASFRDIPGAPTARVEILEDKDWEREWMEHYGPMRFGERVWICPSWKEPPEPNAINLLLDPGLAFGTGTHPTTAMCITALDGMALDGARVVDFGCGSGILGIAALRLGATQLLAVDNDPQALTATADNAARNSIDPDSLQITPPGNYELNDWQGSANLVLANILAGPLVALSQELCDFLAPGGQLVLAGLLDTQAEELIAHYAPRLELSVLEQQAEWVCLGGRLR
ncbi:MAG: ribosomal protein L11 methyltransferase [Glaciecola sp.]|jgi:ribosomal protein L11 methyltransferase|uniref:50S ribosomal protein L11 methyltransferase n=1 Tax=Congregibacter sp. TaxID=2744308 RepID=UPI0039E23055